MLKGGNKVERDAFCLVWKMGIRSAYLYVGENDTAERTKLMKQGKWLDLCPRKGEKGIQGEGFSCGIREFFFPSAKGHWIFVTSLMRHTK